MRIRLPTALMAYGLEGPSASSTVDNLNPQGIHLRNPKTCPNKPSHFYKKRVLITGASGFVGSALLDDLRAKQFPVRGVVRRINDNDRDLVLVQSIDRTMNWRMIVDKVDVVVHLAARVHMMKESSVDPLAAFRKVNVDGTLTLARQAAEVGVKRFIFLSSIKVNGERTQFGQPYTPNDLPKPSDSYGISKCEAEEGLRRIAVETGMEVVIIRPVLVYGPRVKGNFLSMMRWLQKGIPLPLGSINNLRSLVAIDNLVDLIVTCLEHSAAANQTFLVSDGEDLSTTELLKRTAVAMGVMARLIPVPASILQVGSGLLGKRDIAQRLCGSLQVDISKTRELLGWTPPVTVDQALKMTVEDFLRNQRG